MMDSQFLKTIEEKLKRELLENEKRFKEIVLQDPFKDISRINDNAASDIEASEEADHDRLTALKNEITANIEKVKIALKKISDGNYGKCDKCGIEIDQKRLEIFPEAIFCFECERKRE